MNFWEFCLYMNPAFFARRGFLKKVANIFMFVYRQYCEGVAVRVSVSMPPRAGKSYITSLFCAWWLGKFPEVAIMRNACTAMLYEKFSRDVRAMVMSQKYRKVFPHIRLNPTDQSLAGWALETSVQKAYFGAGVGGSIIGFGANLAMSDDLYKSFQDAMSPNQNEKVHEWKEGTHDSRFEGVCPEIFIGTRWLKRDVIGKALEKGRIHKHVKIPALINGESFCSDVRSTEQYKETKLDVDDVIWMAEYMQEPGDVAGALFPRDRLRFYDPSKVSIESEHKLVYIDPADEGGNDLAAPLGYLVGDRIYIPRVICNNNGTDINEQACADLINTEKCHAVRCEGNSAWKLFSKAVKRQVLEKNEDCDYRTLTNSTHKGTRILAQSGFIRNRFIFRADFETMTDAEGGPEYRRFMKTLMDYLRDGGDNQADDAPDALAGMAIYYRSQFSDIF